MTPDNMLRRFNLSPQARLVYCEVIEAYGMTIAREAMKDWGEYPPSLAAFEYRCKTIKQQAAVGRANFLLMEFLNSEKVYGPDWELGFNGADVVSMAISRLGGYEAVKQLEKSSGLGFRDRLKTKITEALLETKSL